MYAGQKMMNFFRYFNNTWHKSRKWNMVSRYPQIGRIQKNQLKMFSKQMKIEPVH